MYLGWVSEFALNTHPPEPSMSSIASLCLDSPQRDTLEFQARIDRLLSYCMGASDLPLGPCCRIKRPTRKDAPAAQPVLSADD